MKTKEEIQIWIESKDFNDRTEFRVVVKQRYPKGLGRKGFYEDYLSRWQGAMGGHGVTSFVPYVFKAYKKLSFFERIFGNDYRNQRRIAIQKCDELIKERKKDNEKPKIINYER